MPSENDVSSSPERPTLTEQAIRWKALEVATARAIGGKITPGSGSKFIKGDAQGKKLLAECKYRWAYRDGGFVFPLQLSWLEGISYQAEQGHRIPVLGIEYGNGEREFLVPYPGAGRRIAGNSCQMYVLTGREIILKPGRSPQGIALPNLKSQERYWVRLSLEELRELREILEEEDA